MTITNVRVRFAPSPTGDPHVGNIRSALFNWLYARHTGGVFVLRIEDTDQNRKVEGAVEAIYESLNWMGLDWNEGPDVGGPFGPYVQSERIPLYQDIAKKLEYRGNAYSCYCTPHELAETRKAQQQRGETPRYDGHCRNLTEVERESKNGLPHVIRFKTPVEGPPVVVSDVIRGTVVFDPSLLDDFVLLKSDGYPTYHLANVVDDHAMQISHVLRAEEWLSSTPRHLLIYQALEYEQPLFGHLPMILGSDKSKLSKRHGATALLDYKHDGYLAEAMTNFLALLGWSLDGMTEMFSREQLIQQFSLERVSKSPAVFDKEKLMWLNGVYIRGLSFQDLAQEMSTALSTYIADHSKAVKIEPTPEKLIDIAPLLQERLQTLKPDEVWERASFFLVDLPDFEVSPVPKGMDKESTFRALAESEKLVQSLTTFDKITLEDAFRALAERIGLTTRDLFGSIRIAVTGRTATPPLFDTLAVLGKDRVLTRLKFALDLLT